MKTNVNLLDYTIESVEIDNNQKPIVVNYIDRYYHMQQYVLNETEQKLLKFYHLCPEFMDEKEITEHFVPSTRLERITMQHVINSI
ncbi:TPA: hypothetical protein ACU2G3_002821 [Staphylococcus aureus]|uniref:hypothetical protein n=1 Tax=Staphylococcus aureus TaxID=1280 RepID=UPI00021E16B4|nr:hypothetical protein [Staphylococcus aureus]OQO39557.1 hypothetical protein A0U86_03410 [Staphylococcus aureus]CCC86807.1 conserved hypothetical protein [Staphylococcus aureus subsp. aureus LGA251]SCT19897.1 Uncharacterised protein [Staphylococcus aureus]VDZ10839.1 Uncharacterised protein [Staphylococcus aureus]HDA1660924.1 hypothetical protein [Staphylococcus aureus]